MIIMHYQMKSPLMALESCLLSTPFDQDRKVKDYLLFLCPNFVVNNFPLLCREIFSRSNLTSLFYHKRLIGNQCPRIDVECGQALIPTRNFVSYLTIQQFLYAKVFSETKFNLQEQFQLVYRHGGFEIFICGNRLCSQKKLFCQLIQILKTKSKRSTIHDILIPNPFFLRTVNNFDACAKHIMCPKEQQISGGFNFHMNDLSDNDTKKKFTT